MNPAELRQLRQLLTSRFTAEDFTAFCFDHFPEVHRNFTAGQTQSQRIIALLEHANTRNQLPTLLAALRTARPDLAELPSADPRPQPAPATNVNLANNTIGDNNNLIAGHNNTQNRADKIEIHNHYNTPAPAMPTPTSPHTPLTPEQQDERAMKAFRVIRSALTAVGGVLFIGAAIGMLFANGQLSGPQWFALRILLALGAAGVATCISGFLSVKGKFRDNLSISATGAIAAFVIIYFFNPADPPKAPEHLPPPAPAPAPVTSVLSGTLFAPNGRDPQPGVLLSATGQPSLSGEPCLTDADGHFSLPVPLAPGTSVTLRGTLDGKTVLNLNATTDQPFSQPIKP